MYKVYGYISDGGDGSAALCWTDDPNSVDLDDEEYYANEGSWAEVLTFDSPEQAKACGITLSEDY